MIFEMEMPQGMENHYAEFQHNHTSRLKFESFQSMLSQVQIKHRCNGESQSCIQQDKYNKSKGDCSRTIYIRERGERITHSVCVEIRLAQEYWGKKLL